jgi:hypothetical protein
MLSVVERARVNWRELCGLLFSADEGNWPVEERKISWCSLRGTSGDAFAWLRRGRLSLIGVLFPLRDKAQALSRQSRTTRMRRTPRGRKENKPCIVGAGSAILSVGAVRMLRLQILILLIALSLCAAWTFLTWPGSSSQGHFHACPVRLPLFGFWAAGWAVILIPTIVVLTKTKKK